MTVSTRVRQTLRKPGKYAQAILRWQKLTFNDVPPVFGNAKPKSGSHLLLQVLNGLCRVAPYAYTSSQPIRSITREGRKRSQSEILADLHAIPPREIGWGYLAPTAENIAFLCQKERVNYFIYRDPRDVLVSHVFFATEMHSGHGMHAYYQSLPNFDARLTVAIRGINQDGLVLADAYKRSRSILDWLAEPRVMCIRFEDLINDRDRILLAMLDRIEKTGYRVPTPREKALEILIKAIDPKKSHTFRSGKTGGWKKHFTAAHKSLFKDVTGDLLIRLGYENDMDW